jgi:hypothetical protein
MFPGGLITKLQKNFNDQIRSFYLNFETALFLEHYSLSSSEAVLVVKAEIGFFQQMR